MVPRRVLALTGLVLFLLLLGACGPMAAETHAPPAESIVGPTKEAVKESEPTVKTQEVEKPADEASPTGEVAAEVEEPPAPEAEEEVAPTQVPLPTPTAAPAEAQPTISAHTPTPQPTFSPTAPTAAPPLIEPTPTPVIEERMVELEWPGRLHLGDSDVVRLALVPSGEGYTVTTEFPDHQTVTQEVPVVRPSGYDLFAVARLDGVKFTIDPKGDQVRSLPVMETVTWHWSLSPLTPGKQRLTMTLLLRWEPQAGTSGTMREAVAYSKGLDVQVTSFFGLTRGQAMTTGLFGAIFGGGLTVLALVYRPRTKRPTPLQVRPPNPATEIELPPRLRLSSQEEALLRTLFDRYARLVIQEEFLSGYSGARTFLLLPIRPDGRADAYTIAKLGDRASIQREFQNYETFIKHTLPPVTARIQNPPVTVRDGKQAALQYTFIGEPGSTPTSLRQSLLGDPDPALLNKLFETFGPNWWMQRKPYAFRIAQEYDRLLPPHYVLEPETGRGKVLDGRSPPSQAKLPVGTLVSLRNFPHQERRSDGVSFSIKGQAAPGQPRLRLRWLGEEVPRKASGRIVAARDDLLRSYVSGFDRYGLPDPLESLPGMLDRNLMGSKSIIHGDLNLENILVGPGDFVWLIDFATTREGHTLTDFAHLEAEIIAHVIAPQIPSPESYLAILKGDPEAPLVGLRALIDTLEEVAGRCLFNPARSGEYHLALYMACLGALKYRNLESFQKHLLYLTAAHLSS
jgi:hypothetical protein